MKTDHENYTQRCVQYKMNNNNDLKSRLINNINQRSDSHYL